MILILGNLKTSFQGDLRGILSNDWDIKIERMRGEESTFKAQTTT